MIETFFEAVTVMFFFIGIGIYLHYLAFVIAWGWAKGRAKVTVNNVTTVNLNGKL
jgi:hypothetical protein